MKTRALAHCRGYLLVNESDEYLVWSKISPHSSQVAWARHPEAACRFKTPEAAAFMAVALQRVDLHIGVLLETPTQWLVEHLEVDIE